MAEYVSTFTKPYPSGYQDLPSEATPVGHEIIESWETAIVALESYLSENNIPEVSASIPQSQQAGVYIASITIDGTQYKIYTPMVRYESSITDGTKVGTLNFGTYSFDVYVPTSSTGGSTVSVLPKTLTGTNIAEITVDGTTYQLYAPTGGSGSGSTVTAEATLTEGTQIGRITIDGTETILYAPTASAITVDDALSATSENPVQNKVVKAEFDQVNSNLSDIKYGEVAGGKNLFNGFYIQSVLAQGTDYTNENLYNKFPIVNDITGLKYLIFGRYFKKGKYILSYSNDAWFTINRVAIAGNVCNVANISVRRTYTWEQTQDGYTYFTIEGDDSETGTTDTPFSITPNIQIEKGTTATEYESYIPSVKMLAEENAQQNNSLSVLGKCKNLLNSTLQTATKKGVTCTANGDGTYTLNGTSIESDGFEFKVGSATVEKGKKYKMIGFKNPTATASLKADTSNIFESVSAIFTAVDNIETAYIKFGNGVTFNNEIVKPMITTNLDATYDDFVPYTGDRDNLTADVASIKKKVDAGGTGGSITVDSTLSTESENPVQNKVVTAELNNIKEELGSNTSKDNLWLDAFTKDKYTYDYPQPSDLGALVYSSYYPNTQISSKELRHYIGLGKYRLSFYAKFYSELETTVNVPLDITCTYKDNSTLKNEITITNDEKYFEIDFDFDKSVTNIDLYVKGGQCLIKNVTLLCMSNVEEKIDKLRKALCDLGK